MVKIGFVFPGQGAQCVGMGKDFYASSVAAKKIFDTANDVLGFDLKTLCFEGPIEDLTQTINAQVAIFTVSMAVLAALNEKYPQIKSELNCGLSLGEYSALAASDVMDFETALKVVRKRGELMETAATQSPGGMVSLIGLDDDVCEEVARQADVDVANFNSPGQIVLSGLKDNIQKAHDIAVEKGARKAIILNVSGAFHSRLMNPAAEGMKTVLADVLLSKPNAQFIPNVTAVFENDPVKISECLVRQVSHSVKWTQSMQYAAKNGVKTFLEVGPGKVLKGLARRIDRDFNVLTLDSFESLNEVESLIN